MSKTDGFGFTPGELRTLRSLKTPYRIQHFLNELPYHVADTAWSPRRVLRERTAHCLEGALFAAAALRVNGFPPLIMDLEATQDTDHVLAVYRMNGCWGTIAKSNFSGLRFREPVYKNIRELAMSYFDDYFNYRGERTLRGYCKPIDLGRFDDMHWMTTEKPVWAVPELLIEVPHIQLISPKQAKALNRVDGRCYEAGTLGAIRH
jgi:hypothetical protein